MGANYIAVRVDDEYHADEFWAALRDRHPGFAASLARNGAAVIAAGLWDELASLPGFGGGPVYAPTALIDCGGEGDGWADVVGGRHSVYESLA